MIDFALHWRLTHCKSTIFKKKKQTIAKMWKQPKCPSTDEWIKNMWYICTRNITQP